MTNNADSLSAESTIEGNAVLLNGITARTSSASQISATAPTIRYSTRRSVVFNGCSFHCRCQRLAVNSFGFAPKKSAAYLRYIPLSEFAAFSPCGGVQKIFLVYSALQGEWTVTVLWQNDSWLRSCPSSFVAPVITVRGPEKRADVNSIDLNQSHVKTRSAHPTAPGMAL